MILFIFVLFFYCYEFISYTLKPEQYRFGSEIDGWRYLSKFHYVGSLIVESFLIILGIIVGFLIARQNQILTVRIIIFFIIIVLNVVEI
jgi:hypothetical protein